jgi:hypothetical protein
MHSNGLRQLLFGVAETGQGVTPRRPQGEATSNKESHYEETTVHLARFGLLAALALLVVLGTGEAQPQGKIPSG